MDEAIAPSPRPPGGSSLMRGGRPPLHLGDDVGDVELRVDPLQHAARDQREVRARRLGAALSSAEQLELAPYNGLAQQQLGELVVQRRFTAFGVHLHGVGPARRAGTRLLGEQAGRDLAEYLLVLRRHAGEARWRVLANALADEERQHLADRT